MSSATCVSLTWRSCFSGSTSSDRISRSMSPQTLAAVSTATRYQRCAGPRRSAWSLTARRPGCPDLFRGLGFRGGDLADVDVAEAHLGPVRLELDRPGRQDGLGAVEEVVEDLADDDRRVVEGHPHAVAHHLHPHRVPFADRLVGLGERPAARVVGVVVPEAARAL